MRFFLIVLCICFVASSVPAVEVLIQITDCEVPYIVQTDTTYVDEVMVVDTIHESDTTLVGQPLCPRGRIIRARKDGYSWGAKIKAGYGFLVLRSTGWHPTIEQAETFYGKFIDKSYMDLAYTKWQNGTLGVIDGRYVEVSEELLKTLAKSAGIK